MSAIAFIETTVLDFASGTMQIVTRKSIMTRLLAFCLAASSVYAFTPCLGKRATPCRYLIPKGYVWWVRIDFNVKDAPPLPLEDGFYLLKIPPDGNLRTSTREEYGPTTFEYFYYSGSDLTPLKSTGWDGGGMIWAQSNGSRSGTVETHEHFFFGTEAQDSTLAENYRDENWDRKIGPISH